VRAATYAGDLAIGGGLSSRGAFSAAAAFSRCFGSSAVVVVEVVVVVVAELLRVVNANSTGTVTRGFHDSPLQRFSMASFSSRSFLALSCRARYACNPGVVGGADEETNIPGFAVSTALFGVFMDDNGDSECSDDDFDFDFVVAGGGVDIVVVASVVIVIWLVDANVNFVIVARGAARSSG